MELRKLSDGYAVTGQIAPGDIPMIRDAGYAAIVCNRPDGEAPGQPSSAEMRAAAEAAGIAYRYNPLSPGELTPGHVHRQADAIANADGPVLAHCTSGKRAAMLWALANPDGLGADERIERAGVAGHDLSNMRGQL
jgi:sulfide:quinone oxidoreductase